MKFCKMWVAVACALILGSCSAPKTITYFQDMHPVEAELTLPATAEIKVMPKDKLSIIVNSPEPRISSLFNLPVVSQQVGSVSSSSASGTSGRGVSGYTIDVNGNIDFPVLGTIHVAGMTREQVAAYIKKELISREQVKDPIVTVEFVNLTISVLGEVKSPGRYSIEKDQLTIVEALAQAGDLTIHGKRDQVTVLRTEGNKQHSYVVDLCSAANITSSPVYYLQQGDVVYVEPNGTRARQSTVNGNTVRSTAFWFSLVSLLTSLTVMIVK